jgi:hypothetical protein
MVKCNNLMSNKNLNITQVMNDLFNNSETQYTFCSNKTYRQPLSCEQKNVQICHLKNLVYKKEIYVTTKRKAIIFERKNKECLCSSLYFPENFSKIAVRDSMGNVIRIKKKYTNPIEKASWYVYSAIDVLSEKPYTFYSMTKTSKKEIFCNVVFINKRKPLIVAIEGED